MAIEVRGATYTFGWLVALIVGIVALILLGLGQLSKEATLLICAVCAVKL